MRIRAAVLALLIAVAPALGSPTRSSPIAVVAGATGDVVFVVNPDSDTVARIAYTGHDGGAAPTHEATVGRYPRTLAIAGRYVFTADQKSDTVSRLDQADLGNRRQVNLGLGCAPYGVAATPGGDAILVSCQGTSEVVVLDLELTPLFRVKLAHRNARAIAISDRAADAGKAYVSHYLTEEPGTSGHVSVVDLGQRAVTGVLDLPADTTTCETQNSGQGVLNLVSALALVPDTAPAEVRGQLWAGGTQENVLSKGLFKRWYEFKTGRDAALFPIAQFQPFPRSGDSRNIYKASFHDISRFGIWKINPVTGSQVGKLDIDEANNATDIEFSADGTVAYVVDLMFNSYHVFNTKKGQDGDVTTLFAGPGAVGPGGADPSKTCVSEALTSIVSERPFRMAPQAGIDVISGYVPVDPAGKPVNTGIEFDAATYQATGHGQMIPGGVPDGIGTSPIGVRLSPDGQTVYVANYLARNVVGAAAAQPQTSGKPTNFRCTEDVNRVCATATDCSSNAGFCNHPGGGACNPGNGDADCTASGKPGPCVAAGADCVPLVLAKPVPSTTRDPLPAQILDGKNLFNTAARDASVLNTPGLGNAAPLFNDPRGWRDSTGTQVIQPLVPGAVVSTSHDASYVTCTTCHADFGGQDGRTWDFSQLGVSLRNTMDLRGRPGFAPGTCSNDAAKECTFDAACGDGAYCKANPSMIPPNVTGADRERYFNPMLTVHWNGDRDEVEDFEFTYRSLMGAGDCDGAELTDTCQGALIQRSALTTSAPMDVNKDLAAPNRNLRGAGGANAGIRLTNMADFVYTLTEFPVNPNGPSPAAQRGARLFNDSQTLCASCHQGGPPGKEFFTDKKPRTQLDDPSRPGGADANNPFFRHNVGTANMFDEMDPARVALLNGTSQNAQTPGSRKTLGEYITPVLNDVWNSPPFLHDGSAHTLLEVILACDTKVDDCYQLGRGRNLDRQHGVTDMLSPSQLNDLVAFQKTLSTGTPVGSGAAPLPFGVLEIRGGGWTLPKGKKGKTTLKLSGFLYGAPSAIDPSQGVTLELGTPTGEEMAIVSQAIALKGGRTLRGKVPLARGKLVVTLTKAGSRWKYTITGQKLDPAPLDLSKGTLTVAFQVGGTTFAKGRVFAQQKNVYKLPKRGRA